MKKIIVVMMATAIATSALAEKPRATATYKVPTIARKHHPYRYHSYYQYDCLCGPEYYPSVPADYISRSVPGCNGIGC